MIIHIASSIGQAPTKLAAFDAALYHAGIANYNLLTLSSVIPPSSQLVLHKDNGIPKEVMPGTWGDRLYVVMAEQRVDTPNAEAWAGIGWVQDKESGKGLFVEHTGSSEKSVRQDIRHSLEALMATRNMNFGEIHMEVSGVVCSHYPACAMVVAAYQASDWSNAAHMMQE